MSIGPLPEPGKRGDVSRHGARGQRRGQGDRSAADPLRAGHAAPRGWSHPQSFDRDASTASLAPAVVAGTPPGECLVDLGELTLSGQAEALDALPLHRQRDTLGIVLIVRSVGAAIAPQFSSRRRQRIPPRNCSSLKADEERLMGCARRIGAHRFEPKSPPQDCGPRGPTPARWCGSGRSSGTTRQPGIAHRRGSRTSAHRRMSGTLGDPEHRPSCRQPRVAA